MLEDIVISFLWSISPFGEAKVGIPYGMLNGANIYVIFFICLAANILVFPIMMFFLDNINRYLLRFRWYKRPAIFVARRAKSGSGDKIRKYGFLGLTFFVMIPLPGTGVYAGSIAAYLFSMDRSKAFLANSVGISVSSIIIWITTFLSMGASF
ncbi:COG2426 family protein [Spongiivirga citrea]|uniref:Ligand-binding protein SH3 n=1 Tax=Spongiivirga citrea TaxID=1481457 RepID=A0A6M0CDS1_9FLAO|nr:small multi-drug export protein [Spongiivirga citrea]NER15871.1 ligand-binding protein SH3 [Spongiivirga citrea]